MASKRKFEYTKVDLIDNAYTENNGFHEGGYVYTSINKAIDDANELGNEGWEIVGVNSDHLFFKREIPNE